MTATAKAFLVLLSTLLAVSCSPVAPPVDENPLREGSRLTMKAFGNLYEAEVTEVHGGYSTWKLRWKKQVFTVFKVYRGIFPIYGRSEESSYHNVVDVAAIDQLFPLEVGKEVSLRGFREDSKSGGEQRLWAHIVVQGEAEIEIRDRIIPVFLIEVSIESQIGPGGEASRWQSRTLWYSQELGFSLKTEYQEGDEYFTVRVLSLDLPGENGGLPPRRNLGTVMI